LRPGGDFGFQRQTVPMPGQIHSGFARRGRAHRLIARRNRVGFAQPRQKLVRAVPVQIADDAVIVEDRHLVLREHHGEEIARRAIAAGFRDTLRRGRAVMAVGDIERRQGIDGAGQRRDGLIVADHPELVPNAVIGGDVECRRGVRSAREHGVDLRRRRVAEHDRPGLRVDRFDLAHPVVFLGRRGVLVAADAIAGVVGERCHRGEPGRNVAAPGRAVDVIARLGVANEHAGRDHGFEALGGLGIDRAIVGIGRRIEVDLRLGDVQKAPRLALGALARLRAREHVIGRGQNFGGTSRRRPQRAEGFYQGHLASR
jgi:hypothetical protein